MSKINSNLLPIQNSQSTATDEVYSCNYIENLQPVTLFENSSGSTGTITLNDSASNYSYFRIFYLMDNSSYNDPVNSIDITSPDSKSFELSVCAIVDSNIQICLQRRTISGTSITLNEGGFQNFGGSFVSATGTILITKVIGYK